MTGRRKKERRAKPPGALPAAPPAVSRAARSRLLRWIPALVLLLVGSAFWLRGQRPFTSSPEPVAPEDLEGLDPEVRRLVQEHLRRTRAEPSGQNHGTLGLVYEAQNMFREAERCYAAATELDGDPLWKLHHGIASAGLGDLQGALALFREATEELGDSAAAHYRLADALLQSGALDEAVEHFEAAAQLAPERTEAHAGLGAALFQEQAYEQARTHLVRATELDPSYRTAHYQLGLTLRALGRDEEAARELALGIEAQKRALPDPLDGRMRSFRVGYTSRVDGAAALLDQGRTKEGMAILEQLLEQHPNDVHVLNNLAVACMQMGQTERSHELLMRARKLDESSFPTWINLAAWGLKYGKLDEALVWAERAVELAGQVASAHQVHGNVLAKKGRWQEAHDSLVVAVGLDARDPGSHHSLALACAQLGRWEEARASLLTATSLDPRRWTAHLDLAQTNMILGNLEEARRSLAEAQKLAGSNPGVEALAREIERRETAGR